MFGVSSFFLVWCCVVVFLLLCYIGVFVEALCEVFCHVLGVLSFLRVSGF